MPTRRLSRCLLHVVSSRAGPSSRESSCHSSPSSMRFTAAAKRRRRRTRAGKEESVYHLSSRSKETRLSVPLTNQATVTRKKNIVNGIPCADNEPSTGTCSRLPRRSTRSTTASAMPAINALRAVGVDIFMVKSNERTARASEAIGRCHDNHACRNGLHRCQQISRSSVGHHHSPQAPVSRRLGHERGEDDRSRKPDRHAYPYPDQGTPLRFFLRNGNCSYP